MYLNEKVKFCTRSKFEGFWDINRSGTGVYTYPNGTQYRGKFENGLFQGEGVMILPTKFRIVGTFDKGKCLHCKMFFPDGLEYKQNNWNYCKFPDRRYYPEILNGINPIGDSYLTKDRQPRSIPKNCFDIEEGFGEADTGLITEDYKKEKPLRYLSPAEKQWMIKNCRAANIESIGRNKKISEANYACEKETLGCWGSYCYDVSWSIMDENKSMSQTSSDDLIYESSDYSVSEHGNSTFEKNFNYDTDIY